MTAKKSKKVKLLICRRGHGSGSYEIGANAPETIKTHKKMTGFEQGYLVGLCPEDFEEMFPSLRLKKRSGPLLIEVSVKLLKMPKKKAKK